VPFQPLLHDLRRAIPDDRVLTSELRRVAFASDASMYHLVPRVVVLAADAAEVAEVMRIGARHRVPVTFRAAGTSLSGQAVTDGILVEVARHWRGATIEENGGVVRARPGMIGAHLNTLLAPYGRRIGPDPSSLAACTLGGILANNSSGPCSGTAQNAYHTLRSLTFVLPGGTEIDTARPDADERLRHAAPRLHEGLGTLRRDLLAQGALRERVARKYRSKNTTGFGLNALLDFERPVDILAHLLIGSEGTLAFIAEAVLETVPLLPHTSAAFLLFPSVHAACDAIGTFRDAGAQYIELLDEASLRAIAGHPGIPDIPVAAGSAALLTQVQAADPATLEGLEANAGDAVRRLRLLAPAEFTRDAATQAHYLHARKGLYPAVGGARASGTTLLLEDVAFPVERLADASVELQGLFRRHDYRDAVIFGHAKDGNLHFLVTQPVGDPASVERYGRFMDDVVDLVVTRHDGALKAEHGTGRNMAPFVETEWGADAVALMRRIKELCDPDGVLSPGVILPSGPRAHLEHLKGVPTVEAEVDRCVECGYCEPVCPSRTLTLTPRQRIVVRRERARREAVGDRAGVHALDGDWGYEGLDTCAADGLCATACPVGIDTGALVTRLRAERHGTVANGVAAIAAENFGAFTRLGRAGTAVAHAFGLPVPAAGMAAPSSNAPADAVAVYFPSCMGRVFDGGGDPLLALAARAGVALTIPDGLDGLCCGLPFHSKGHPAAGDIAVERTRAALRLASRDGAIPVVVDGSSCTHALVEVLDGLTVTDAVTFARESLLPRLTIRRLLPELALHIPCAARHLGIAADLEGVARVVAERVTTPGEVACCGFAGDRGFLRPELTASAAAPLARQFAEAGHRQGATANLPCGVGMAHATGIPFPSVLQLLDEATRP
jgi:D-lactate dehydrogenase